MGRRCEVQHTVGLLEKGESLFLIQGIASVCLQHGMY